MSGGLYIPEPKLVGFGNALNRVFRGKTLQESSAAVTDYKVFICEEEVVYKKGGNGNGNGNVNGNGNGKSSEYSQGIQKQNYGSVRKDGANGVWVNNGNTNNTLGGGGGGGNIKKRVLNFWAFSPGIAMEDLKKLGVLPLLTHTPFAPSFLTDP